MKQRDVMVLLEGIAPAIVVIVGKAVEKATAALTARLEEAEKRVADLSGFATQKDVALLAAAGNELGNRIDDVGCRIDGLRKAPTAEEVAALVPVPIAKDGTSVTIDDIRPILADMVAALPVAPTKEDIAALFPAPKAIDEDKLASDIFQRLAGVAKEQIDDAIAEIPPMPTAQEVAAFVPAPAPGRDADPEIIKAAVLEEVTRQIGALPLPPSAEAVAALVPAPSDGQSVSIDDVTPLLEDLVGKAVAALPLAPTAEAVAALVPVPADGKSITAEDVAPLLEDLVGKAVAALPVVPTAEAVAALIPAPAEIDTDALAQNVAGLLEAPIKQAAAEAVSQIPTPRDGKDVELEEVAAIIKREVTEALSTWERPRDGKSVSLEDVATALQGMVEKAVAALPVAKDGVGLAGALIDRQGHLVLTLTDGTTKDLGLVLGADGLGFEDLEAVDEPTAMIFRFSRGDRVKEFAYPKPSLADFYKGIWKDGAYKAGETVTFGGSLWLVRRNTSARPETNDDFVLVVKKGRDGKDGELKAPAPKPTVKL